MTFCSLCGHAFEHGMLTPRLMCMECLVARMVIEREKLKQVPDLCEKEK
jgi:DNA-directed RNA polymerase subunit RPC12/RpoP